MMAQRKMAAHHSLSSFGRGDEPVFIPWDEAFAMIGPNLDPKTMLFNEKNTTIALGQAVLGNSNDSNQKVGAGDDAIGQKVAKFISKASCVPACGY